MIDQNITFVWAGSQDLLNSTGFMYSPGTAGGILYNGHILLIEGLLTGIFTILTMFFFVWLFFRFRMTRRILD